VSLSADTSFDRVTAQGGVEGDESLVEAARRELAEETGPNMDVWSVGRVPAGAYSYPFPAEHIKKNPGKDSARVRLLSSLLLLFSSKLMELSL